MATPLYNWISRNRNDWVEEWNWFSSINGQLYKREGITWYMYRRVGRSFRSYSRARSICPASPVNSISRASVSVSRFRVMVNNSCPITTNNRQDNERKTFQLADRIVP